MVHQRPGVSSGGATLTVTVFQVPGDFSAVKKSLFTSSPSPKRSPSQEWTGKDLFLQFARTSFFFVFFRVGGGFTDDLRLISIDSNGLKPPPIVSFFRGGGLKPKDTIVLNTF